MENSKKIKVLCVCSENYTDTYKIKETLFKLNNYKDRMIVSTYGLEENVLNKFIYKQSIVFEYNFKEFPLYSSQYNINCIMPRYKFNKPYHPMWFSVREDDSLKWADFVFVFISKKDVPRYSKLLNKVKKLPKSRYSIST